MLHSHIIEIEIIVAKTNVFIGKFVIFDEMLIESEIVSVKSKDCGISSFVFFNGFLIKLNKDTRKCFIFNFKFDIKRNIMINISSVVLIATQIFIGVQLILFSMTIVSALHRIDAAINGDTNFVSF